MFAGTEVTFCAHAGLLEMDNSKLTDLLHGAASLTCEVHDWPLQLRCALFLKLMELQRQDRTSRTIQSAPINLLRSVIAFPIFRAKAF